MKKTIKLSLFEASSIIVFVIIVVAGNYTDIPSLPFIPRVFVYLFLITSTISAATFNLLLIFEIFKKTAKTKVSFVVWTTSFLVTLPIIILFSNAFGGFILSFSIPLFLISFVVWIIDNFKADKPNVLKKMLVFVGGIIFLFILSLISIIGSAFYISAYPKLYGYPDWAFDILSAPDTLKTLYYFKTGLPEIPSDYYLKDNSQLNNSNLYFGTNEARVVEGAVIQTPKFKNGKIAFIKNNNLWLAENNGRARAITNDTNLHQSDLFTSSVDYRYPVWSPGGDKIVFVQDGAAAGARISRIAFTDGKVIHVDPFTTHGNLLPYWIDNQQIIIPSETNLFIEKVFFENGNFSSTINPQGAPYFGNYNLPTGCDGGGGFPEWKWLLAKDNFSYAGFTRPSLFYIPIINKIEYSVGCGQEVSVLKSPDSNGSDWFDPYNKPNDIIKSLEYIKDPSTNLLFRVFPENIISQYGPNQLVISKDKNFIVGINNGNVVLYDSKPSFLKTIWKSGDAYNPVFSSDSKYVYFVGDSGGKPNITKVNIVLGNSSIIFAPKNGEAIAGISPSPDDKQLVFTLITQTRKFSPESGDTGQSKEDIYLINNDGTNPILFATNASQPAWSPQ